MGREFFDKAQDYQKRLLTNTYRFDREGLRKKYLVAANNWRASLKESRDSDEKIISQIKKGMEFCYARAMQNSRNRQEKDEIRQEENYSQIYLKELDIRKTLNEISSQYRFTQGKKFVSKKDITKIEKIKSEYIGMINNLNIPERYLQGEQNEREDILRKIIKVDNILKNASHSEHGSYVNYNPVFEIDQKVQNILKGNKTLEEELAAAVISVSLFLASLFFASTSFTGNIIGGITEDYSRIIGLCLFVCGLVFTFIYFKKNEYGKLPDPSK